MAIFNSDSKREFICGTILSVLGPRLSRSQFRGDINASTQLLQLGLVDSTDLLDLILEVEQRCAVAFDPARVDFEERLTLGTLVAAFATS
jgi:acyl carrier protein